MGGFCLLVELYREGSTCGNTVIFSNKNQWYFLENCIFGTYRGIFDKYSVMFGKYSVIFGKYGCVFENKMVFWENTVLF